MEVSLHDYCTLSLLLQSYLTTFFATLSSFLSWLVRSKQYISRHIKSCAALSPSSRITLSSICRDRLWATLCRDFLLLPSRTMVASQCETMEGCHVRLAKWHCRETETEKVFCAVSILGHECAA